MREECTDILSGRHGRAYRVCKQNAGSTTIATTAGSYAVQLKNMARIPVAFPFLNSDGPFRLLLTGPDDGDTALS